jgi:hypothetical protein
MTIATTSKLALIEKYNLQTYFKVIINGFINKNIIIKEMIQSENHDIDLCETEFVCLDDAKRYAYSKFSHNNIDDQLLLKKRRSLLRNKWILFWFNNFHLFQKYSKTIIEYKDQIIQNDKNLSMSFQNFCKQLTITYIPETVTTMPLLDIGKSCYSLNCVGDDQTGYTINDSEITIDDVQVSYSLRDDLDFTILYELSNHEILDMEKYTEDTDQVEFGYSNNYTYLTKESAIIKKNNLINEINLSAKKAC